MNLRINLHFLLMIAFCSFLMNCDNRTSTEASTKEPSLVEKVENLAVLSELMGDEHTATVLYTLAGSMRLGETHLLSETCSEFAREAIERISKDAAEKSIIEY